MAISAKVICDSISPTGARLTTVEAVHHRFILPQILTHRLFSRNSASLRAIPTARLVEQVRTDPAMPVHWGSNIRGMQAGEELRGCDLQFVKARWKNSARHAADTAEQMAAFGLAKEVGNRVLIPYLWNTIILTATSDGWDNFFEQRIGDLAQPEIDLLAQRIHAEMTASVSEELDYGEWHMPYLREADWYEEGAAISVATLRRLSVARCARVSYNPPDGKRDPEKDLTLYQRLVTAEPPHWSPLEHVATPAGGLIGSEPLGNLTGWHQLRHLKELQ